MQLKHEEGNGDTQPPSSVEFTHFVKITQKHVGLFGNEERTK
jgi:hypothetical protein